MKVLIRQFLSANHSWACVGRGLAKSLIKQSHTVDLFPTDGMKHLPIELKKNVIGYTELNDNKVFGSLPESNYDCQISYTAMKNFPLYLSYGNKNRFGIWCTEWQGKNILPNGFAKNYKACDFLCPPSEFAKKSFMDSGIPESSIKVISHGVEDNYFNKQSTIKLPTNKKFKILANFAQNHLRKNIPGTLTAYGEAFTIDDNVCLILKAKHKPVVAPFEVSLQDCLNNFYKKYPKHGEIKILSEFIPDISDLYRNVDATYSLTFAEAFYFPALEGIISGKLAICPNWGGQLDFLNENNSLLVSGKEVRANPNSMYWEARQNAIWFEPSIEDAVQKLRFAYKNYEEINRNIILQKEEYRTKYSWDSIVKQFLSLCN